MLLPGSLANDANVACIAMKDPRIKRVIPNAVGHVRQSGQQVAIQGDRDNLYSELVQPRDVGRFKPVWDDFGARHYVARWVYLTARAISACNRTHDSCPSRLGL